MKFYIYKGKDGWRWRLISRGRIVAESGEGYARRTTVIRTLGTIRNKAKNAPVFTDPAVAPWMKGKRP